MSSSRFRTRQPPALALAALLLATPFVARAQVALDMQASVGAATPTGFLRGEAGVGPAAQLAISGSIPYTPLAVRGSALGIVLGGRGDNLRRTSVAALGADLVYKFRVAGVQPYLLLGPSFYLGRFTHRASAAPVDPLVDVGDGSFFRGGFGAGGGVQAGHGRVRGFVEGTYHALRLENAYGDIVRPQFVAMSAGVQVELRKGRVTRHW